MRQSTGVSVAIGALVQGTPYRFTYYNTAGEFILHDGVAAIPGNFSIGGTLTVTGQATFNGGFANPAALRNASNLNVDGLTAHGDSAYAILATDRVVATSAAFAASRTWTLPAANAVNPGQMLTIADEANGITSTNTLVVARAGSDAIVAQGTNVNSITLTSVGALITLISDGSSKWIVQSLRQAPQVSVFTSGTSQTYTTPVGALYLKVRMCGGGGGGGAQSTNNAAVGTDTSLGSWTAIHGSGGAVGNGAGGAGGTGGVNGTGTVITRVDGGQGNMYPAQGSGVTNSGGTGGANPFGGAGPGGYNQAGIAAKANTGAGGSGAGGGNVGGAGGGAGEYLEAMITSPAATYTYTVGTGGNGGAAGGLAGGNGAAGRIEVIAYFQ